MKINAKFSALKSFLLAALLIFDVHAEAKQHRSGAARAEFQRQQPCPSTGEHRHSCPNWVIDHVIPLCSGKTTAERKELDAPSNMQWQTVSDAKKKDRLENKLCRGKISMDQYMQRIR